MVIHEEYVDGHVEHTEFQDRESWFRSLRNPQVRTRWTHVPGDCESPSQKLINELRSKIPDPGLTQVRKELSEAGFPMLGHPRGPVKVKFGADKDAIIEQMKLEKKAERKVHTTPPTQTSLF